MEFKPFVYDRDNTQIPISIEKMTQSDAELTNSDPVWQTAWTSEYLRDDRIEKYAAKAGKELVALGAYEILESSLIVRIFI